MAQVTDSVSKVIEEFAKLPGIGRKSAERLAYPIRDGIPVMLEEEARVLAADDPRLER